jgi:single-strand DNA-binding protein
MALGETMVTVVGTITSELEFKRVGDDGHELVTFWLRSNERRFDKAKGEWVDGRHLSVLVKCRRRLALAVRPALQKGDPVLVTGRMSSSEYRDEEGRPRSLPEVEASAIGPNLMLCVAPVHRGKRPAVSASPGQPEWQRQALIEKEVLVEVAEPVPVA